MVRSFFVNVNKEKCLVPESNQRHEDFQSSALPTELTRHITAILILNTQTEYHGVYLTIFMLFCHALFYFFEKNVADDMRP